MLYYVILCYVMLCYIMLYYVILHYIMPPRPASAGLRQTSTADGLGTPDPNPRQFSKLVLLIYSS